MHALRLIREISVRGKREIIRESAAVAATEGTAREIRG